MIPLRDHHKTPTFPFITYILITINVVIFIMMLSLSSAELEQFILQYALIPQKIVNFEAMHTLITSMFLHGSIGHIVGNMLFLNVFGDNLEDALGHFTYLLFYIVTGLGASALQIFVDPTATIPNLGASGAIAGLLGSYLVLFPNHRVDVLVPLGAFSRMATVPASTMLIYWIIIQIFGGIGSLGITGGGIAYFAHIGGFITGLVLITIFKPFINRD